MKKVFLIGWKDVTLAFRDRAALIMMLLAPFALTLGLGFVTGRFSTTSSSGVGNIPVALVNQDGGQLGNALVELFQSKDLADLVTPRVLDDPAQARQGVDADQYTAAIIIPAGFTDSMIPGVPAAAKAGTPVQVALYTNPTSPTGSAVVKTILDEFMSRVEIGQASGMVTVTQLISQGLIQPQDAARVGAQIGASLAGASGDAKSIPIKGVTPAGEAVKFDPLAFMAPGMALMFLMYTVTNGGRSLQGERAQGTLPRLLVSPTTSVQVLGGKVLGIYLTGVAQMLILIVSSTIFFQLNWGDPLAVLLLILAAVAGAVGWGMIITALARTPGQIGAIGSAVMLIFGILGGSFISLSNMPAWFQVVSRITPNAWGLDGFTTLALGGRLPDIFGTMAALLAMGALLFTAAVVIINRRGINQ